MIDGLLQVQPGEKTKAKGNKKQSRKRYETGTA